MDSDVVVAGGGLAGLTAALTAQQAGARVLLLEKAPQIGGSSAASGGTVWCAADLGGWLSEHPDGDPALGQAQLDAFRDGIGWLQQQGVRAVEQTDLRPYRFERVVYALSPDAAAAMDSLANRLTDGGGTILVNTSLRDIRLTTRGVVGGVQALGPDGFVDVTAPAVILASGGFQGSPELRARYMGRWSDRMVLRAQAQSTGDGLLAALGAGAATAGPFSRFYGHMMPAPPAVVGLHNFAAVKPDFSEWAVFVNLRGERFDDEYLGDMVTVHAAIHQDQAMVFLVFDDAIRRTYDANPGVTRLQHIRQAGGEIAEEPSLEALAAAMATNWGVGRDGLLATLQGYNAAARADDPGALSIPKSGGLLPLETPPFYAIRCVPGITFTYGGACVNARAEVLDTAGGPIRGLFGAGADAGGVYTRGYTGGLSLALSFGRIAGRQAAAWVTTPDHRPDS